MNRLNANATMKIDATKLHEKIKALPIKQVELAKEIGVNDAYFANCKRDNAINPLVFKYVCQKFGWDEKEFEYHPERKVEEQKRAVDNDDMAVLIRTLNSMNSTLLEINRRLGVMSDKLATIDGKAANINLGVHETEIKLTNLIKELTGK